MITFQADIWCEGCDWLLREPVPKADLPALELSIFERGWTRDGDKHFCPRCSKKRVKAATA